MRSVVADAGESTDGADPIEHPISPASAVRNGFDATALLVLWLLRCATPALFLAGVSYAWLVSGREFAAIADVSSPGQAVRVLVSPFFGIALAIILRFVVGVAALVLAYPLGRRQPGFSNRPKLWGSPFRMWADRLYLIRAYRSLRWTSGVRQSAADRIGKWGRVLAWSDTVLLIADGILFIALIVVVYLNPRS